MLRCMKERRNTESCWMVKVSTCWDAFLKLREKEGGTGWSCRMPTAQAVLIRSSTFILGRLTSTASRNLSWLVAGRYWRVAMDHVKSASSCAVNWPHFLRLSATSAMTSGFLDVTWDFARDHRRTERSLGRKLSTTRMARFSNILRYCSSFLSPSTVTHHMTSARFVSLKWWTVSMKRCISSSPRRRLGLRLSIAKEVRRLVTCWGLNSLTVIIARLVSLSMRLSPGGMPSVANDLRVLQMPCGLKSSTVCSILPSSAALFLIAASREDMAWPLPSPQGGYRQRSMQGG
mmetsp:Transcript_29503/g.74142  ORF Transcript_29503/g.74142 Transcript_29503/m.74142 type:complete len:289 (+) Transcript_29503:657-1523(+)